MSEFVVRLLAEGEQRAAFDLICLALHATPMTDERWDERRDSYPADRKFGAFAGDRLIGAAGSFGTEMAVPGGKVLPTAAVDGVGVRPDHTRRGVLTAMMGEQLRDCAERGDVLATLHASEATIYGRFGYGVATRSKSVHVSLARARFRDDAPRGGHVRLLETDEAKELIPPLYQRIGLPRPGMVDRPEVWWSYARNRLIGEHLVAVHTGPDGDDGFVLYKPAERRSPGEPDSGSALSVRDLHAANVPALAGLWRFLLKIDLISEVRAPTRPLDEPIGAMLVDPRACETVGVDDEMWLRLVDVPAALAARSYRPSPRRRAVPHADTALVRHPVLASGVPSRPPLGR